MVSMFVSEENQLDFVGDVFQFLIRHTAVQQDTTVQKNGIARASCGEDVIGHLGSPSLLDQEECMPLSYQFLLE